jgi:hypothetical protein
VIPLLSFLTPRGWAMGGAALLLVFGGVQTLRLGHAKGDLSEARQALLNPVTHKTWQSEAKRDAAALGTCHASVTTLEGSLASQNAAVASLGVESARRTKMLADGLEQARKGRASAEARAAGLLKRPPAGIDACARSEAARRAVLESLK